MKHQQGTWDLHGTVNFSIDRPRLVGGSRAARKTFASQVRKLVDIEKKAVSRWRAEDCAPYPDQAGFFAAKSFAARTRHGDFSVLMNFAENACNGVPNQSPRAFTFDAARGRLVGIGQYASNRFGVRDTMVKTRLYQAYDGGCGTGRQLNADLPHVPAWFLTVKAAKPSFPRYAIGEGACADMRAVVPWSLLPRPDEAKGKTKKAWYAFTDDFCGSKYCGLMRVMAGGKVVSIEGGATGDFGYVGVRRGRTGTFATLGSGAGDLTTLRFKKPSMVAKPASFGADWVRISKKVKDQYWPGWLD